MNYIKHLTAFYERLSIDNRLNPVHISMYLALFQAWNLNRFQNPFSVCREQLLLYSRIGSLHTYYKCLYDLHEWGYIEYIPSRNPVKGSLVNLCIFDTSNTLINGDNLCKIDISGDALSPQVGCKNDISGDAKMHPSLNNINILNNKTICSEQSQIENRILDCENMNTENQELLATENSKRKKVAPKKENGFIPPALDEVQAFFKAEDYPEVEASKFFNHFESNGWKVGGKSPMKNWHAAARNWMLNSQRFVAPQSFPKPQLKPKPDPQQ